MGGSAFNEFLRCVVKMPPKKSDVLAVLGNTAIADVFFGQPFASFSW
jgi:hypothetical protein